MKKKAFRRPCSKSRPLIRIMKIYSLLVCLTIAKLFAVDADAQTITLNVKNVKLSDALSKIEGKSDFNFFYNNSLIDVSNKVSITAKKEEISTVLNNLFIGTKIDFALFKDQIVLFPKDDPAALVLLKQMRENIEKVEILNSAELSFNTFVKKIVQDPIKGVIIDSEGLPLPGVSVVIKGTTRGTQTDFDGNYEIVANSGETLVFTYLGMHSQSIKVGQSTTINITMQNDLNELDEVIVIAYGTATKESLTGAAGVIRAKDLELRPLSSPIAGIEGAITGVQVTSASGQPGSSPSIVIRGVGSLNGGFGPLFIVDGVQFEGALSSINQEDIQSMTVLKDAASTALYGSRAAGGVVIITTKGGKRNGSINVNISSQFGVITKGVPEYDATTPGQYYELMWEAYKNTLDVADPAAEASATIYNRLGYNPFNVPNDQIVGTDGKLNPNAQVIAKSLDWYDLLEQTGSRQSHSANVSSGGENHDVYLSTSYLKEEGYVITSNYDRVTTRLNGNFSPTKWLDLSGGINLSETTQKGPKSRGGSIANPFGFAKDMGAIYPIYLVDPTTGEFLLDEAGEQQYDYGEGTPDYGIRSRPTNVGRHALAEAIFNSDITKVNNIGYRYSANFKLLEGLSFKLGYGRDIQDRFHKKYENHIVGDGAPGARYRETRYRRTTENFNQILSYNKTFGASHNFDVILGHESFNRNYSEMFGFKNTQTAVGITEFDNFSVVASLSGYTEDKKLEGYFTRLNYNYNNKYYLSLSARKDGTSVFDQDVRWGTFYSIGASWRLDQEKFMENISFINRLKLRASYGEVGNDDLKDYYISQDRYSLLPNAGDPGIFWSNIGSKVLTWETVESWDIALDFALFNNRLEGSFEYYKKNSTDLLYNKPIPLSNGLNESPENIGDMYNQGYELGLTGHILKNDNFNWSLTMQASTLKNEITFLPRPFIDGSKRWDNGHTRYDYYIYHYAGVDPANGDALYYMWEDDAEIEGKRNPVLNDDGTQATTHSYQTAGKAYTNTSPIPDVIGSVTNRINYKNISLDFMFLFSFGGEILDYGYADMMHEGSYGESLHPDMTNAWRAPGDITNVPRLQNGESNQFQRQSTRFLTDASYYALRNVSLSYTLVNDATKRIGINKLRFFVSGENLFLKSKRRGLNPQYNLSGTPSGNDYNPSRIISMGLNLSF